MKVDELNPEQYKELCQEYILNFWTDEDGRPSSPSLTELACADELVSQDVIFNYYKDFEFTDEYFTGSTDANANKEECYETKKT